MAYILVGGSNYDDGMFDGLWSIDYEKGTADLSSDDADWLKKNGTEVIEYQYDLESYLKEQNCTNIVDNGEEYSFDHPDKEIEA